MLARRPSGPRRRRSGRRHPARRCGRTAASGTGSAPARRQPPGPGRTGSCAGAPSHRSASRLADRVSTLRRTRPAASSTGATGSSRSARPSNSEPGAPPARTAARVRARAAARTDVLRQPPVRAPERAGELDERVRRLGELLAGHRLAAPDPPRELGLLLREPRRDGARSRATRHDAGTCAAAHGAAASPAPDARA